MKTWEKLVAIKSDVEFEYFDRLEQPVLADQGLFLPFSAVIPQRKDYIINRQNRLNAPGYIARAWAHYNTFRGAPFPREMSQSEC